MSAIASAPTEVAEAIIRSEKREISLLVASAELCLTHARYGAGEPVAKPHVHRSTRTRSTSSRES
jgi:hypothetical protein